MNALLLRDICCMHLLLRFGTVLMLVCALLGLVLLWHGWWCCGVLLSLTHLAERSLMATHPGFGPSPTVAWGGVPTTSTRPMPTVTRPVTR